MEGGDAIESNLPAAASSSSAPLSSTHLKRRYFGVAEFPSHREYLLASERGAQSRRSFGAQQDYKVEKEAATDNDTTADSASVGGEAAEAAQKKAEEDAAAEEEAANEVPTTIPPYPTPPHPSQRFPPTTYYLLPTTYYLPRTTYYLLPTTYYLLPITFKRGKKPHTRGAIAVEGVTAGTRSDWDQVGSGYPASLQCIPSHPIPSHPIPFHSILSHPTGVCTPQAGGQAEVD